MTCLGRRRFLKRFSQQRNDSDEEVEEEKRRRKRSFLASMLGVKLEENTALGDEKQRGESAFQYLKRMLTIDIRITVWEFDSTTLAHQLTMLDRELFLKV